MASIKAEINSKYNNAGVNAAKSGLQSLGQVADGVQKVFKGFLALKAIQFVGKGVNDTLEAYQVQQKAISQLTLAISNNSKLTEGSLKRIISYTSELQGKSVYGDEVLQGQATYLSNLGLTEEQIKKTLAAAADLTSSGIGTLEKNVKNLGKTFNGMTGELGESISGMKELTKEQLKAGAGVDLIAQKYKGFASNLADNTLEGLNTSVGNIVGDIKEKIGSIFGTLKTTALSNLKPLLISFDAWLEVASKKIINLLMNLPQAFQIIGTMISTVFKNAINIDYLFSVFAELWKFSWEMAKTLFINIGPLVVELFKTAINYVMYIQYRLAKAIDLIGAKLSDAFMGVAQIFINSILKGINNVIETINKIPGVKIGLISDVKFDTNTAQSVKDSTGSFEEWFKSDWSNSLKPKEGLDVGKNIGQLLKDSMSNLGTLFENVMNPLSNGLEDPLKELNEILNKPLEVTQAVTGNSVIAATAPSENAGFSLFGDSSMNPLALLGETFQKILGPMAQFQALMDPLGTIFAGMMEVLSPLIESLLTPLVGILKIVGQTIGKMLAPALQLLGPIIEGIAKVFVWLYNGIFVPIYNAIKWVQNMIINGFLHFVNAILSIIDSIPFVDVGRVSYVAEDAGFLDKISLDDVNKAGADSSSSSTSTTGSSASYSGPSNYYININYDHSYINGDAREIALNIRNELRAAEAMGY